MARARNIKPAIFKNELLGVADPLVTLLFESLWCLADREGRLEDRPLRIKAETFPYRDGVNVNGFLDDLQSMGFIVRYTVNGQALIEILNFKKHQTPHNTEKASDLPARITVKPALGNGELTAPLPPDSLIPDSLLPIPELNAPAAPDAPAPKRKEAKDEARGTRLAKDWHLPKAWGEWALAYRADWTAEQVRKVADAFLDHWLANANQPAGKKSDWEAAWRNWVRKEKGSTAAKPANAWFATDASVLAKGVELNMRPRPGESIYDFKGRVQAAIDNGGVEPRAPPAAVPIVEKIVRVNVDPATVEARRQAIFGAVHGKVVS